MNFRRNTKLGVGCISLGGVEMQYVGMSENFQLAKQN